MLLSFDLFSVTFIQYIIIMSPKVVLGNTGHREGTFSWDNLKYYYTLFLNITTDYSVVALITTCDCFE